MMYRPMSLKSQEKKATSCSTWPHAVKFNGIDGQDINMSMNDYIDIVWKHVFEHGMRDDCTFFHHGTVYNFIQGYYLLSKALRELFLKSSKQGNDDYSTTNL